RVGGDVAILRVVRAAAARADAAAGGAGDRLDDRRQRLGAGGRAVTAAQRALDRVVRMVVGQRPATEAVGRARVPRADRAGDGLPDRDPAEEVRVHVAADVAAGEAAVEDLGVGAELPEGGLE